MSFFKSVSGSADGRLPNAINGNVTQHAASLIMLERFLLVKQITITESLMIF